MKDSETEMLSIINKCIAIIFIIKQYTLYDAIMKSQSFQSRIRKQNINKLIQFKMQSRKTNFNN